jgi:hypothetical protein
MPDEPKFDQELEVKPKEEENKLEAAPEEPVTIMPTMIDDSEIREESRRDLSAIIPKETQEAAEGAIALNSKENELKGDGAISIGTINTEGEVTMNPNAKVPEQIDLAERKKQAQKNKGIFKKEKKKVNKKIGQKVQNITALISLVALAIIGGFYYWYKNRPTEKDFKPKEVHVELGDSLPIRGTSYVTPGVGKDVDELQYAIDLKDVKVEVVGEYPFTVTYKGIQKTGKVIVEDTTPPELVVKEYVVKEGTNYDASKFVVDCVDYSGCNYSFQTEAEGSYDTPGSFVVHVTASDAYQNTTTKKTSLIIESVGTLKKYVRYTAYNFKLGYEKDEEFSLTFMDYDSYSAILRGTYKITYRYQKEEDYREAVKTYSGEADYTFYDANLEITHIEKITAVGSNYTKLDDVEEYLKKEQFQAA